MHALFPVPAVLGFDGVLQCVEVTNTLAVSVDEVLDVRYALADDVEDCLAQIQSRFLRDVRNAQALLQLQAPVIRLLHPRKDLEQRRLAGAIASDQADPLVAFQRKIGVIKKSDVPEGELGVEES